MLSLGEMMRTIELDLEVTYFCQTNQYEMFIVGLVQWICSREHFKETCVFLKLEICFPEGMSKGSEFGNIWKTKGCISLI